MTRADFPNLKKKLGIIHPEPLGPNVKVTDIVVRGGGGTITFSDNVTLEFIYNFTPDENIPSGGIFGVTLIDERAALVYQNVISQSICDMIDWIMQYSDLNRRVSILEEVAGLAKSSRFITTDWTSGANSREIKIIQSGVPGAGELGPHEFTAGVPYAISVFKDSPAPVIVGVDLEMDISLTTGNIILRIAPLSTPFDGRVIISSSIAC